MYGFILIITLVAHFKFRYCSKKVFVLIDAEYRDGGRLASFAR